MIKDLPKLEYDYDALEPFIDKETMHYHRDKHHQTYLDKLNEALEDYPELASKPVEELLSSPEKIPENIRKKVLQNCGQFVNHNLFFEILKKDVEINEEILAVINKNFGNFENFKEKFSEAATNVFGSGWVWLVVKNKRLEILSTANHENPLILKQGEAILVLDLWEHAYYLKYKNNRKEFVKNFFNIINWDKVNEIYKAKMKGGGK